MKKIIIFLILFLPFNVYGLSASSVTVMDMDTNRVLYSYNESTPRLIASITKIMTSLVALNNSNINDIVTINETSSSTLTFTHYKKLGVRKGNEKLNNVILSNFKSLEKKIGI